MYLATKTYGNDRGLSCCFRNWRSNHSHCSTLHGYSIGIELVFEAETVDERNWVMDFGNLKAFKNWADHMFDHTLLVAKDDPHLAAFEKLAAIGDIENQPVGTQPFQCGAVVDLRIVDAIGCEAFAKLCFDYMSILLEGMKRGGDGTRYPVGQGVKLRSAKVFEHGANSATYEA